MSRSLKKIATFWVWWPLLTSFLTWPKNDRSISCRSHLNLSNAVYCLSLRCAVLEISGGCFHPPAVRVRLRPAAVRVLNQPLTWPCMYARASVTQNRSNSQRQQTFDTPLPAWVQSQSSQSLKSRTQTTEDRNPAALATWHLSDGITHSPKSR